MYKKVNNKIGVITPPTFVTLDPNAISIFLGGSIEMDKAELWQEDFITRFEALHHKNGSRGSSFAILNPRRANWDITVKNSIEDPVFYQQVTWELQYLEEAKARVFYFAPNTISPISLLEFGKFFTYPHTYLVMHPDYNRAGNLEIFANKYKIKIHHVFDEIISTILWL